MYMYIHTYMYMYIHTYTKHIPIYSLRTRVRPFAKGDVNEGEEERWWVF